MPVITVSRELGSMGTLVAEQAAHTLGYHLADKNTIATLLRDYGVENFKEEYQSVPRFWEHFDTGKMKQRGVLLGMLDQCLQALAQHGDVVIVGRGGFAVLGGLADVLNVRIQAPLALRAQRLMELPTISDIGQAEKAAMESDQLQQGFVKSTYDLDWNMVKDFDMVLNTGRINPSMAADLIVQATRGLELTAAKGDPTAADLEVDGILAEAVHDLLAGQGVPAE